MTDQFDAMAHELAGLADDGYFDDEAPADWDENLSSWPNCATPDCPNKRCCWGSPTLCHPCEERIVGKAEMTRRYVATRDAEGFWNGCAEFGEQRANDGGQR